MSLLSAGKQISVGGDMSYGRGLFIADPAEVEKKARKKAEYQEQLRMQMQEDRRRKQDIKRKQQEEDMRLEQKIKEDLNKEIEKKPEKQTYKNDKNYTLPTATKSQVFNNESSKVEYKEKPREEQPNYKFNIHLNTDSDRPQANPYLPRNFNLIQAEEDRFFEENNNHKIRAMSDMLEEKLNEVFKKIKMSQNLEIEKQIDIIRKKIASSNGTYESENPKYQQFDGEISYFYKIPKKINTYESRAAPKNLMYDTSNYQRRNENIVKQYKPVTQTKMDVSRQLASRESRNSGDDKLWGAKKGKDNYLGNREAMDFQINSIMGKIDNLLQEQDDE